jgi:selenocysteine lyase/cysteine desulfurase
VSGLTPPTLVGGPAAAPLLGGGTAREVDLDFAASAPALTEVADTVAEFLPWYASVHRGAGWRSRVATAALEQARTDVASFVGARPDDVVVFTGNTTQALNTLAAALPAGCTVLTFAGEHHANLLPWRRNPVVGLGFPGSADEAVDALDAALHRCAGRPCLVAVTGASNVTGEIWPITRLAAAARRHGARIVVDAAQLAPHAPVDIAAADVDWIALSGHKLYAPYGAGALVGRRDWLDAATPLLRGGGAVRFVTDTDVSWDTSPARHEAGSPNVVGIVALAAACRTLARYGMRRVAAHERALIAEAFERLDRVPGLTRYRLWPDECERIAVVTFALAGWEHGLLAAALSAEHGVAVRDGCFCAHPLLLHLLRVPAAEADRLRERLARGEDVDLPGAVRISAGLTTTTEDIDRAAAALLDLATRGPRHRYRAAGHGHYEPLREDRPLPSLAALGGADRRHPGR